MKIGFIGLGNMGAPMAINLAKSGHELVGYDSSINVPKEIFQGGSAQFCAKDSDVVVLMLPNGVISKSVAFDILPIKPTSPPSWAIQYAVLAADPPASYNGLIIFWRRKFERSLSTKVIRALFKFNSSILESSICSKESTSALPIQIITNKF